MPGIGLDRARLLMKEEGYKAKVLMEDDVIRRFRLFHPEKNGEEIIVRRDCAVWLVKECIPVQNDGDTVIMRYNHDYVAPELTKREHIVTIGYKRAKNLMMQLDWKLRVTMNRETLELQHVEIYHPKQPTVYSVRRDSARILLAECRVIGPANMDTAIMCYDHDGSNEDLI